jgi:hypothetical protein
VYLRHTGRRYAETQISEEDGNEEASK